MLGRTGERTDDGSVFTGGQTDTIEISVSAADDVVVRDRVPTEWDVLVEYSDDVARVEDGEQFDYVYFDANGDGATDDADAGENASYSYLVEAPSGIDTTDAYEFGPVEVNTDGDAGHDADSWIAVSGTGDRNYVLGAET